MVDGRGRGKFTVKVPRSVVALRIRGVLGDLWRRARSVRAGGVDLIAVIDMGMVVVY